MKTLLLVAAFAAVVVCGCSNAPAPERAESAPTSFEAVDPAIAAWELRRSRPNKPTAEDLWRAANSTDPIPEHFTAEERAAVEKIRR